MNDYKRYQPNNDYANNAAGKWNIQNYGGYVQDYGQQPYLHKNVVLNDIGFYQNRIDPTTGRAYAPMQHSYMRSYNQPGYGPTFNKRVDSGIQLYNQNGVQYGGMRNQNILDQGNGMKQVLPHHQQGRHRHGQDIFDYNGNNFGIDYFSKPIQSNNVPKGTVTKNLIPNISTFSRSVRSDSNDNKRKSSKGR